MKTLLVQSKREQKSTTDRIVRGYRNTLLVLIYNIVEAKFISEKLTPSQKKSRTCKLLDIYDTYF